MKKPSMSRCSKIRPGPRTPVTRSPDTIGLAPVLHRSSPPHGIPRAAQQSRRRGRLIRQPRQAAPAVSDRRRRHGASNSEGTQPS